MTDKNKRSDTRSSEDKSTETEAKSAPKTRSKESDATHRSREKRKESAHPNVRVWRGDRQIHQHPPSETEKKDKPESKESTKDTTEEQVREKTGRKLWLKVEDSGKVKKQKAPAGHEKHRHLTSYRAEEQDEQRRKIAEFRHRRKMRARMQPKPKAQPTPPVEEKAPEPEELGPPIEAVYTIGIDRTSPQKFMQKLVNEGISLVFDLRSDEAMFAPGFAKGRDLAILLKEAAGIDYRRDEVLVPRRELVQRLVTDKNFTRYAQNYAYQLSRGRVEKIIDRDLFVKHNVALIGETKKGENDQRHIAAEYLKEKWGIYSVVEL